MKALAPVLMAASLSLFTTSSFAKSDIMLPMDTNEETMDFGEVYVGDYVYDDIDVVAGDTDMTISEIALTGDMFQVAHNCPDTLPAGKTCHIFVIFEPTATGDFTGELSVKASIGDYLFHLMGSGYEEGD
ncbi:hypothetical protein [Bdellovibrio sp. NC01]|uniref:hypothetical protein n=1 Tax=Bdellovibrio sp. NC01 TaxID=2220073 RepID=UPI001158059E|nr:hypothetical protein [Bdellovibrio sp. NC01]QDK37273.1 hypothetical protein DOE51_06550 [Bdellovibrio sp. NC01]